ncbi:glycosyltransferase [Rivularia sp. UHCC 0363]|nr:glycosyltransferase [Rivularia sp. UHCC 0363]MEA5598284.1 glycosyltransferase [Rivularia sp. UHCC 0363]
MLCPQVTLIVVPHQCFSCTQQSLESIYKYTKIPFKLIYIDGYSPQKVNQYLEIQSQEKGFLLIRTEKYVSPNQARNIGLKHVDTEYVVFLNNDVLVKDGWLNNLIKCAQETDASVVSPICVQGNLAEQIIHFAGGSLEFQSKDRSLDLFDRQFFVKDSLHKVKSQITRKPTQIIDFNCVLVRTSVFQQIDNFDEKLMSVTEEIDFCLSVLAVGENIYLEPESTVSFVPFTDLITSDFPYYFLRWSYIWNRKSVNHFQEKWNLAKDAKFITNVLERVSKRNVLPFDSLSEQIKFEINKEICVNPKISI